MGLISIGAYKGLLSLVGMLSWNIGYPEFLYTELRSELAKSAFFGTSALSAACDAGLVPPGYQDSPAQLVKLARQILIHVRVYVHIDVLYTRVKYVNTHT